MREVRDKNGKVILKDRTESKCTKCKKGVYREMYFHDDMDGVLHCNRKKCNHEVNRWIVLDKTKAVGFNRKRKTT